MGLLRLAGIRGIITVAGTLAIIKKGSSELQLKIFNAEGVNHG